jgi:hypothetical protein
MSDQWNESLRGQRMSNPTGLTIFKYQMPVLEEFSMTLPKSAQILRVEDQGGMFWMWALVDLRNESEVRKFRAFKTGAPIPDDLYYGSRIDLPSLRYIGFCKIFVQMELGLYIFEDVS